MDTAKEIFSIGRHRTITVEEAEQKFAGTVGSGRERFICPECGEYVAFVRRYEYRSYFKHGFSNETTKECDLRSISQNYQTIYERIGLPLYIRKNMDEEFELCVGFYTLDESIINKAEREKLKVTINPTERERGLSVSYFVDSNNYLSNATTLKKIDFLSKEYSIHYSQPQFESLLQLRWGRYIEGILNDGAIFTYNEYGGRKIRINEEITTDVDYLYLCLNEHLLNRQNGIIHEYCGSISLKSRGRDLNCNIYKIVFKSRNDAEFDKLYKYCRDHFKLSLLYEPSKLSAVWPPTIMSDNQISIFNKHQAMFILKGDETNANIFIHKGSEIEEVQGNKVGSHRLIMISVSNESKVVVTLNGKYNSVNSLVTQFNGTIKTYGNIAKVQDRNGNILNSGEYTKLPHQKSIMIESESKCDVLLINNNRINLYHIRDSSPIIIDPISYGDEIVHVMNNKLIYYMKFIEDNKQRADLSDDVIYTRLHQLNGTSMVYPPFWIKKFLTLIDNYPKTKRLAMTFMMTNKMPSGAEKILSELISLLKEGVDNEG